MSIVCENEQRVHPDPEPYTAEPVRTDKLRRRARRWLAIKRRGEGLAETLTVRQLARRVGAPLSTVAAAVHWAEEDERRREEREVERFQSPEICPVTGLTIDDVIHLASTYDEGTELGSLLALWAILDPLLDQIFGPLPDEASLPPALVA